MTEFSINNCRRQDDKLPMMSAVFRRDLIAARDTLKGWLSDRLSRSVEIVNLQSASGMSHEILIVEAVWREGGMSHTKDFIIRVDPAQYRKRLESNLRREFDVLTVIGHHGSIPAPKVYWYETDTSLLGAEFYAMERIYGQVPLDQPPFQTQGWLVEMSPEDRGLLWRSAISTLAAIHTLPIEEFAFLRRNAPGNNDLERHLNYWYEHYQWSLDGGRSSVGEEAWAWLFSNIPNDCPHGLSWGDARFANLLFRGSDCVGVIDWEDVSLSSPLIDFGRWFLTMRVHDLGGLPQLPGIGGRRETLDLWEKCAGFSSASVRWFEIFSASCAIGLIAQSARLNAKHDVDHIGPRIINAGAMDSILKSLLAEDI